MENRNKWKPNCMCPVCGQFKFKNEYDICHVCFWENEKEQFEDPELSDGINHVSLNEYKAWWDKIEKVMPVLIKRYDITISNKSLWKYENLKVSRKHKDVFIAELTKNNIFFEKNMFGINILAYGIIASQNQI